MVLAYPESSVIPTIIFRVSRLGFPCLRRLVTAVPEAGPSGYRKEIINRGGEKISPAAVDEVLQSNAGVEDALSFAVPDEKYGEEIYAAVVLRPGHWISEDELKAYSGSGLSAFEVPKRIYFLARLPRTEKEPATGVAWRRCSRQRCNHDRGMMETLAAIVVAVAIVTVVFLGIIVVSAVIWSFLIPL